MIRSGVCALLLASAVAGDRVNAQIGLPNYEAIKESQIWQHAGHIGAGLDFEACFGGSVERRLFLNIDQACLDDLQPNQLWEPTGFATYQSNPSDPSTYRLYVADRINQRLVVFGRQTSFTAMEMPDGQHLATVETFDSSIDTDGDLLPNTTLNTPESVSVDAVGTILIADSGNSRVLVLNAALQYQFEINYGTPDQVAAFENPFPYYLTLTPGTVVQTPGGICVPNAPGAGRIFVANTSPFGEENANGNDPNFLNQIIVYDCAFNELDRIGTASQLGSSAPGEFKSINGLTLDAQGRLYVSDYVNARVQVFLPTGVTDPAKPFTFSGFDPTPALIVDDPAPTNVPIEPWGVMIDDRNRLVIAQPNRERISVFNLDWDGPGPTATWAFELTAQGQIQGAPHHIEQDSLGRWLISTPYTDQIDVFITPELAVFDQVATPVDTNNDGLPDVIRVEFSVATPVGQTPRPNAHPFAGAVDPVGLGAATGPFPSPLPVGPGNFPDEGTDIAPGTYARWYFLFPITDRSIGSAAFNVWATSDGGVTAQSKTTSTLIATCVSTAPTNLSHVKIFDVSDPIRVAPTGPGGNMVYGPNSDVWLFATDSDGVVSIHFKFSTSLTPVDTLANQVSFSLPHIFEAGSHTIEYWAIDACNTVSEHREISLYVDSTMNDPPLSGNDTVVSSSGTATFVTVSASSLLGNDTDPNNDPLTITGVTQGAAGTVTLNPNGMFTYTRPNLTVMSDVFKYTVSDGHRGTSTATVTVQFNRPPVCGAATANPPEIWPPDHKTQYNVGVTGVTDPDGNPFAITITAILQDEPVDTTGDGKFSPDGGGVATSTAWVRAERMGVGNGRVYEIRFKATDSSGGSCTGSVYTTVPHSKRQQWNMIDSGVRYDSTVAVPGTNDKNQNHKNK